jgi:RHS repeat-associated protein
MDEPITVYGGSGLSANWYASDQEGSIIATADASANLTAAYDYGPYGEPLTSGGAPSWGGARYRYTGQIEIPGAQTYFYKARMYDPGNGRFFQTDPAGLGGGINIYAYAVNDPVNGWDPWGLRLICGGAETTIVTNPDGSQYLIPGYNDCGGGDDQITNGPVYAGNGYNTSGSGAGSPLAGGPQPLAQPPQPQNNKNCEHALEVADNLEGASKIAGAAALGTGVAGAGIEIFSGGLATPVAGLAEVAAGIQEVASLGLGAAATVLRVGATGKLTSVVSFALPQVILNATGLAGISSFGKLAQSAASVGYENTLGKIAPQSQCHT